MAVERIMKKWFGWSKKSIPNFGQIIVAIAGMTVPIIVGVSIGKPEISVFASFGGLVLSGEGETKSFQEYLKSLLFAVVSGLVAVIVGGFLSSDSTLRLFILPVIIFAVSLSGGISRTLARYTTLFLLFLIIAASFASTEVDFVLRSALFLAGAAWTFIVAVVFWPIRRRDSGLKTITSVSVYSVRQLILHWNKSLRTFRGWQYALRFTLSAIISVILIAIIPMSHMFWILLTVGILVQRNIEHLPARILQRGIGTFLGVLLLGAISLFIPGVTISIIAIALFAGFRVYLKENNYLLYSVTMTALVVILLDFGRELSFQIMIDRLVATIIGCAVSFVFGYLIWIRMLNQENRIKSKNPTSALT